MDHSSAFDVATVLADAQRKEALTDWGPGEFEGPLTVLLGDYAGAELNAIGVHILRAGIVHSLRMRLRTQEWIRRHPEILARCLTHPCRRRAGDGGDTCRAETSRKARAG